MGLPHPRRAAAADPLDREALGAQQLPGRANEGVGLLVARVGHQPTEAQTVRAGDRPRQVGGLLRRLDAAAAHAAIELDQHRQLRARLPRRARQTLHDQLRVGGDTHARAAEQAR
jgi:hypothetical protein